MPYPDLNALRNDVNTNIIPNGNREIEGIEMNRILNGLVDFIQNNDIETVLTVGNTTTKNLISSATLEGLDVVVKSKLNGTGLNQYLTTDSNGKIILKALQTSDISSIVDSYIDTKKGVANGIAPLNSSAKIDTTYLPDAVLGNVKYKGTYNIVTDVISSDDPALNGQPLPAAGSGNTGFYFIVQGSGTVSGTSYTTGDWIISNGSAGWAKVDNSDAVSTVFGRIGNVIAVSGDYNTSQVTENPGFLYYTDARARLALTGDATSGISYSTSTGVIALSTTGVSAGTYNNVTVDIYGRVTAGSNVSYELQSNKATDLISPDNTKYPTTLAVSTAIGAIPTPTLASVTAAGNTTSTAILLGGVTAAGGYDLETASKVRVNTNTYFGNGANNDNLITMGDAGKTVFRKTTGLAEVLWITNDGTVRLLKSGYVNLTAASKWITTDSNGDLIGKVVDWTDVQNKPSWIGASAPTLQVVTTSGNSTTLDIEMSTDKKIGNRLSQSDDYGWLTFFASADKFTVFKNTATTNGGFRFETPTGVNVSINRSGVLTTSASAVIHTLTVGLGAGSVSSNTMLGYQVGNSNTTSYNLVYMGYQAGYSTIGGADDNVAIGWKALYSANTYFLTAIGSEALYNCTLSTNTAVGAQAGKKLGAGSQNTFIGTVTASNGTVVNVSWNTLVGHGAFYNLAGSFNTSLGASTGVNSTGNNNLFLGYNSGNAMTSGSSNVIIGSFDGTGFITLSNNIFFSDGDGTVRARVTSGGNWLFGTTTDGGYKVYVNGTLGTTDNITMPGDKFLYMGSDYIRTNGARLMTITSFNGIYIPDALAVGITPSAYKFEVNGTMNVSGNSTFATIIAGTWNGSVIGSTYGGTGVNNGSSTITIGGNVTFSGAFTTTLTVTANTSITLPTTGTLINKTTTMTSGFVPRSTANGTIADGIIRDDGSNAAIGTAVNSSYKLLVNGAMNTTGNFLCNANIQALNGQYIGIGGAGNALKMYGSSATGKCGWSIPGGGYYYTWDIENNSSTMVTFLQLDLISGAAGSEAAKWQFINGSRVLIGTTTSNGYKLEVNGTSYFGGGDVTISSSNKLILDTLGLPSYVKGGSGIITMYGYNGTIISGGYVSINPFDTLYIGGAGNDNYLTGAFAIGKSSSPDSKAILELSSTTKGFLPPRMTATQAEAISSPTEGLMIYSTNGTGSTITSKGWWGYDGSAWVKLN